MKIIIILILICLTTFGTAFAQTDFTDSARSKATANQFKSDSDNLSADDIFDIERTFFSAGYQPSLNLGNNGTSGSMGTMTGFWAMPINDNITIGVAGEYKMDATRVDTSILSPTTPTIPNGIFTQSELTEKSSFNIRPVFKFGDFAFSYRIYRSGEYKSTESKTTIIPSGTEILTNGTYASGTFWEHEIGFAWQTDMFKLYVPIGAVINMDSTTTASHNSVAAPTLTTDITNKMPNNTKAYLYINPEITFPVAIGPITQFKTGINFKAAIYNPSGGGESITVNSGDSIINTITKIDKKVVSVEDQVDVKIGTFLTTTMEWTTWEDKISFMIEPEIGINYQHINSGKTTETNTITLGNTLVTEYITEPIKFNYENIVTPYLDASVGTTIKFTKWFEFRAGLAYGLEWKNTTSTTSYEPREGGKITDYDYTFVSTFEIYSGFGFVLGEDFFIDIYIAAGNVQNDNAFDTADLTGGAEYDLLDIRNYGVQLSYRF